MLQRTVTAVLFTKRGVEEACESRCVELHYLFVPEKLYETFTRLNVTVQVHHKPSDGLLV